MLDALNALYSEQKAVLSTIVELHPLFVPDQVCTRPIRKRCWLVNEPSACHCARSRGR